jgi:hypothetical protein
VAGAGPEVAAAAAVGAAEVLLGGEAVLLDELQAATVQHAVRAAAAVTTSLLRMVVLSLSHEVRQGNVEQAAVGQSARSRRLPHMATSRLMPTETFLWARMAL